MPQTIETFTNRRLTPVQYPQDAWAESLPFGPNLTIVAGQAVAVVTATGKGGAYANGGAGGLGACKGLSMYDFTTDATGKVLLGGTGNTVDRVTPLLDAAPFFIAGTFDPNDLTNFDATAQGHLGVKVLANGFYRIP